MANSMVPATPDKVASQPVIISLPERRKKQIEKIKRAQAPSLLSIETSFLLPGTAFSVLSI